MDFKRKAAQWHQTLSETAEKPFAFVQQQVVDGTAPPSYVQALLEKGKGRLSGEDLYSIKWSAASIYTGGADTTASTLSCFFLAMVLNPHVQERVHEEIDRVIGTDRLPALEDRNELPYVDALLKEVLRWHPVGPMGFPHVAASDDVYEGHFIPKGSILMANIHGFLHDAQTYHDPDTFNPDRFLGSNPELDPHTLAFGFGRRSCPGRELANNGVWLR